MFVLFKSLTGLWRRQPVRWRRHGPAKNLFYSPTDWWSMLRGHGWFKKQANRGYYTEADEDASGGEADRTLIFFSHGPSPSNFRALSHSGGHWSLTRTMEGRKGMSRIRKTKIEFDAYFLVSILAHYRIRRAKWQSRVFPSSFPTHFIISDA